MRSFDNAADAILSLAQILHKLSVKQVLEELVSVETSPIFNKFSTLVAL